MLKMAGAMALAAGLILLVCSAISALSSFKTETTGFDIWSR
jgi:hypothetical protein